MPGLGQAKVSEILTDAKSHGYDGWIAIEPHVATVFHAADPTAVDWTQCYNSYVEYGQRLEKLVSEI